MNNQTVAEIFERFVASQTAKGVSDKTIQNYHSHLHSLQKHLDFSAPLATLTKEDLDSMVISMRQSGLAHNSISSYLRVFRTFLNWARKAGYTELEMANYKDKETVKETYTDAELMLLLQKPARSCDFCEYRNWVIINFLVNCGCRAGTIRNIQNRDVDFERKQVIFRHTKTGKIQTIPLCSMLVSILSDYVAMRGGEPSDYLFCSVYGTMLSENALKLAIADYNHKRGVLKTSIHTTVKCLDWICLCVLLFFGCFCLLLGKVNSADDFRRFSEIEQGIFAVEGELRDEPFAHGAVSVGLNGGSWTFQEIILLAILRAVGKRVHKPLHLFIGQVLIGITGALFAVLAGVVRRCAVRALDNPHTGEIRTQLSDNLVFCGFWIAHSLFKFCGDGDCTGGEIDLVSLCHFYFLLNHLSVGLITD